MKTNKILFSVLGISLLSLQAMAPSDFIAHTNSSIRRFPAAETPATLSVDGNLKVTGTINIAGKDAASTKDVQRLKYKMANLQGEVKKLQAKLSETKKNEQTNDNKAEEDAKIEALTKLIADQKAEIEKLKLDIKNSEVKVAKEENKVAKSEDKKEDKKENKPVGTVTCKAESKGEKLEADVKKNLEDSDAIIAALKKENAELKKSSSAKDEDKKSSQNPELIALMSQMTSMFSTQMQAQMQMQVQMLNMLSQMQETIFPQMSPYTLDLSQGLRSPYALNNNLGGLGVGWNVGISANSQWPSYRNPYSTLPELVRQPASANGVLFSSPAMSFKGFDFNQPVVQPSFPAQPAQQVQPAEPLQLSMAQTLSL